MTHRLIIDGELTLHGYVGNNFYDDGFTAFEVSQALAELEGDVTVRVNSGGGSVWDGTAIYNALKARPDQVTVKVDGVAASAASLIAMAGDQITMGDRTMMMIHDPSAGTVGPASEHEKTAELLHKIAGEAARIYAERSGNDRAAVRQMMLEETWFTPEEAVAAGFADSAASEPAAAAAVFDYRIYANAPAELVALAEEKCGEDRRITAPGELFAGRHLAAQAAQTPAMEVVSMTDKQKGSAGQAADKRPDPGTVAPPALSQADIDKALASERERTRGIRRIGAILEIAEAEIAEAIDAGTSTEEFQAKALETVQARKNETGHGIRPQAAEITADARDRFAEGVVQGLLKRANTGQGERNEFTGMTLSEIARESLGLAGIRERFADRRTMIGRAFTMAGGGHSTSDFPAILADIAHKMLLVGYEEAEETFQAWTRQGTLTDFKTATRTDIGSFPSLDKKVEGAEYKYVTVGDRKESIVLATYGNMFKITREAVINDDLGAFTRIPRKMGRAAIRTVGDLVYAILTANGALDDGVALFHANHNNLASSGAAPSVTTWDEARTAMATQKEGDAILNIRPAYTLVPVALESTSRVLAASEFDPAQTQRVPNPVAGMVGVIADARLDADSTGAYYFAADPNMHDTVEVAYLNGETEPYMEERTAWSTDGAEFKVRIDAGVAPLDYRAMYKNPGA